MSVSIAIANRKKFNSMELFGGSSQEKASAAQSFLAYAGKFKVSKGKVIHTVQTSLFPNWLGTTQTRYIDLKGKKLTLSTNPFYSSGKKQIARLVWERVAKN